uniref:Peptidase C1A papain C-terminal domain-containing protein n=1 Tax=Oreochromis aureus TaxID=47969 RepID=A0A668VIU0_OREAU
MQLCNALVLLVQQASFLLRAALLCILLSGLQHVLADSDEEAPTEWQIWKSRYGISYDELVRQHLDGFAVDYRSMGFVTEVKDQVRLSLHYMSGYIQTESQSDLCFKCSLQGFCGSCWAFSTTGAIEAQLYKKTGQLISLSEQNLMDCSKSFGTYGCSGAWMANAYDYVVSNGLESSNTYPYTSVVGLCCLILHHTKVNNSADMLRLTFISLNRTLNEQAMADALATIGPITVAIDADHASFLFYSSGIYDEPNCNPNNLNHAVLLVGYGSQEGQDYWIIKNSWGTGWGEGGYMRIVRNGQNACGLASYALYPIL